MAIVRSMISIDRVAHYPRVGAGVLMLLTELQYSNGELDWTTQYASSV